jgi:carbon monoxide dehydrogenase subunit G
MKVSGTATLHADREAVWAALNDPAILVRTIPGCQRLETVGPDSYAMTLTAGVASIKGVYQGKVRISDQDEPGSFVLTASGAGAPGTVDARVDVVLTAADDSTTSLSYDADATVGGMIGGVGQRMLSGVAKKTASEFFGAVDDVLTGQAVADTAGEPDQPGPATPTAATAGGTAVYEAPGAGLSPGRHPGFAEGAVFGVVAALAGALVGGWLAGRRSR